MGTLDDLPFYCREKSFFGGIFVLSLYREKVELQNIILTIRGGYMPMSLDRISFKEVPQEVFKDLSEYKRVRANILKALAKGKRKKRFKGRFLSI